MRPIPAGYQAHLEVLVTEAMTVRFGELGPLHPAPLHPVYATYEIARHFEEVGRKLLLAFLDSTEEGVGTAVSVEHLAPALPGMRVHFSATFERLEGRRLHVTVRAVSELGDLIATGQTTQYVSAAEHLSGQFADLRTRWLAYKQTEQQRKEQYDH
jgi:fluoroacetyl-CoA thioesterase